MDPHEVSSTLVHVHRPNRCGARIARIAGFGGLLAMLARFAQPSIKCALAREKVAAHFRIAYLTKSGNL